MAQKGATPTIFGTNIEQIKGMKFFTKRILICISVLLMIIGIVCIYKFKSHQSALGVSETDYPICRQIQYQFTLRNKTDRVVKNAEFWTHAPVAQTATQRCAGIKSSYPYQIINDMSGNQALHFTFDQFPPYAVRIITVKTELLLSNKAHRLSEQDLRIFLKPEKYIESKAPELRRLAQALKGASPLKTAEKIFKWVAGNIRYAGYLKNDRGALYALSHKKGDCTEFMYLFAALCRASNIPARCIGGYICKDNKRVKPADYHNWAEFYIDGTWRISDPQNNVFMKNQANYIAMRLISPSTESFGEQFNRFRFKGAGLQAKMNI